MADPAAESFLHQHLADSSLCCAKLCNDHRRSRSCKCIGQAFCDRETNGIQGGLSTAGGSVTLGLIADLYEPDTQHWPLCFIVLSSTIGTSIGGVIGGPIEKYLTWQWNFWIQLIFGVVVQAIHFFMPESRSTILMDREAKRRRESGEDPDIYGPNELKRPRVSLKEAGKIWLRPFEMFVREPIVLFLSLLSGFSDALIFTFLEAFAITYPANFGFGGGAGPNSARPREDPVANLSAAREN